MYYGEVDTPEHKFFVYCSWEASRTTANLSIGGRLSAENIVVEVEVQGGMGSRRNDANEHHEGQKYGGKGEAEGVGEVTPSPPTSRPVLEKRRNWEWESWVP